MVGITAEKQYTPGPYLEPPNVREISPENPGPKPQRPCTLDPASNLPTPHRSPFSPRTLPPGGFSPCGFKSRGKVESQRGGEKFRRPFDMPEALMIKTKEGRFLLAESSLEPSLLHFAKTHKASLFRVRTSSHPLKVNTVVTKLNRQKELPTKPPSHSEEVPLYLPPQTERTKATTVVARDNYQDFLNQAQRVKEHIKGELRAGNKVSLQSVQKWARQSGIQLSKGGLSRHLQKALDWAVSKGYQKIKEGRYYRVEK